MTALGRIWNRVKGWVSNRYEAASQTWGGKSWLMGAVQDARFDCDSATRTELVRKHRYWIKNSDVIQKIRNVHLQFTVGPTGLQCIPNSSDEGWNDARTHSWAIWAARPEISSNHSLRTLMLLWSGSLFDDGEFFVIKTEWNKEPRLQTIAAHRCKTPPDKADQEGKTIIDGIEVDAKMKPIAYYFLDSEVGSTFPTGSNSADRQAVVFKRVPADQVIHKFQPLAVGQMRGLPKGFSVLNTIHDYHDLQLLEMKAARKQAEFPAVITNATGEADVSMARRILKTVPSQDSGGNTVAKARGVYYEDKLGGGTLYAKTGETVTLPFSTRPSVVTQQYFDQILNQICMGYNTPRLLVAPVSIQGTVARADLDTCAGAFRFGFEMIKSALCEIYSWQTGWAIKYDLTMDGKPPDHWDQVVIRPPRMPNVDIGRNANALAMELKIGTTTYQDVYAERQQDWRQQFRQAAEAAYVLKQLAMEFSKDGVEISVDDIACKLGVPTPPEPELAPDAPEETPAGKPAAQPVEEEA